MTIEDKKQQENLKNFDRNLKESTDQLAWFLYWMFAAVVLVLGMTLIFDGIFYRDAWMILCYVWMVVFMDNYVLAPYQWSMKPSAGGCKNRMRFQKYFGLFRFREKTTSV